MNEFIVDIILPSVTLIISLAVVCCSFAAAWIASKTLKSNNKMIKESTRPYVIIYSTITNYSHPHYRIVIKNFGKTAALISGFEYDENVLYFIYDLKNRNPFGKLIGLTIAPNQRLIVDLDPNKIKTLPKGLNIKFEFNIKYKNPTGEEYTEVYTDSMYNKKDLLSHRPTMDSNKKSLKVIAHGLLEISDSNL